MRYKACTGASNCLVFPRQIKSVKLYWLCNQPGIVRSEWFEAIGYWEGGQGKLDSNSHAGHQLIDRGTTHSFANITATSSEPRKLQVVASHSSDNGKSVHIRYIDSNGNRYYSAAGVEGETLSLSTSGTLSTSHIATNGWYHIVKATTNYPIRVYSYDTNSATQAALLAYYEPSETHPIYRQYYLPDLVNMAACSGVSSSCSTTNKTLEVLAKLQHVDVVAENDPFVLTNLAALKLACKAILMEERHEMELSRTYWEQAEVELDGQLSSYLTDGMIMSVRTPDVETWGAGGICNV